MNVIKLENIFKTYDNGKLKVPALKGIDLCVENGEFLSIVGASGSGKSTLMNIIGCLDVSDSGNYFLLDKNVAKMREKELSSIRRKNIGFVFQKFNLISTLNAFENVALPLMYANLDSKKREKQVKSALESVGLLDRMYHKPNELSGGQQQRVAIARAIVTNPQILLADEPTGNLDSKSAEQIMKLLCELNKQGVSIVLITHDSKTASFANRQVMVQDGKIV
ncbi:MAG: ABC transporter ATP-binding protein [Clostridia bacterium]|nr:ABC transporter ATP-binding protein [Clostridia bacterium]